MDASEIMMWSAMKISAYAIAGILAHWPSNWGIRKIIGRWRPEEYMNRVKTLERLSER